MEPHFTAQEVTTEVSPVPLIERTGCTWPIGDRNFLFCNAPIDPTSRNGWCCEHHKKGVSLHYVTRTGKVVK